MSELIGGRLTDQRFLGALLAGFSIFALVLAALGLASTIAYAIALRTREIALRMALGADPGRILALAARQGWVLLLAGLGLGIAGSLALSRVLASQLFEVGAADPLTYGTIIVVLTLTALVAIMLPARRATRIDPMIALRAE